MRSIGGITALKEVQRVSQCTKGFQYRYERSVKPATHELLAGIGRHRRKIV